MQLVVFERRERDAGAAPLTSGVGSMGAAALGFETLDGVRHGHRRLGALLTAGTSGARAGAVVDLNRALAVKLAASDAGAPEAEADSLLPADMASFLRRLPDSGKAAREALAFVDDALGRYDAPDLGSAGVVLSRRSVRLVAPVPRPGKLLGLEVADAGAPQLFLVAPTAVAGPEDEIRLPPGSRLAFRGQLAAVIGRRARELEPAQALDCVAGYCAAIALAPEDGDPAEGSIRWSGDGFSPLGPALVTRDEAPDPHDLRLVLRVSGRTVQSAHTKELPIALAELVARASARMTLEPGDVVLSGAPAGGMREQPGPLADGDVVELEIERVGRLALYVRSGR